MANKAINNRQKPVIRIEPSQRALKSRNPIALAAKQRVTIAHGKVDAVKRQTQPITARRVKKS
jgi:hypothetical protein